MKTNLRYQVWGSQNIKQTKKFNIDNNKWAAIIIETNINQHLISEGSRDTEDWSNDAENSALSSQEISLKLNVGYSYGKGYF